VCIITYKGEPRSSNFIYHSIVNKFGEELKVKSIVLLALLLVFHMMVISSILRVNSEFPSNKPTVSVGDYLFFTTANLTCTRFNVSVSVYNVTDMWGFGIKLGYNMSQLEAIRVYPGAIPKTIGTYDWVPKNATSQFNPTGPPTINNTRLYAPDYAYVWAGFLLTLGKSFTGSGEALIIEFHIVQAPPREVVPEPKNRSISCVLDLWDTELYDSFADPISHNADDGLYLYSRPQIAPTPPIAEFTWTPTFPRVNENVTFNASASRPDGGFIVKYTWSFGDSNITTTTDPIVTHRYGSPGNYTVTLNVTDSEGEWDTVSKVVEIVHLPYATKLLVRPQVSTIEINDTFVTGIIVNNVVDLYSFEFKLGYNSTILDVTDVWVMWPDFCVINETVGVVWIGASSPFPYPFSGNGTLAVITFKATGFRGTVLDLYDTMLVDLYGTPIGHDAIDGYAEVILHDVAVVNISPSAIGAYPGKIVKVTFTVVNKGTISETFWVAVYFNRTATGWVLVGNQTVANLAAGAEKTVTFVWNTTGVPPFFVDGKYVTYTFNATASGHPKEVYIEDNVLVDGEIELRILGDVNGDGKVSLADVGKIILLYSLIIPQPHYPPYVTDVNRDCHLDLGDVGKMILIYSGCLPYS